MLGRAIAKRPNPPTNRDELVIARMQEWDNIPQQIVQRFIRSLRSRVDECIQAKGGPTHYSFIHDKLAVS